MEKIQAEQLGFLGRLSIFCRFEAHLLRIGMVSRLQCTGIEKKQMTLERKIDKYNSGVLQNKPKKKFINVVDHFVMRVESKYLCQISV